MAIIERDVIQFFPMVQGGRPNNMFGGTFKHQIVFSDRVRCNHLFAIAGNILQISQSVEFQRSVTNIDITQSLMMSHGAAKSSRQDVTQFLGMWQSATIVRAYEQVEQSLQITQSVLATVAKPGTSTLNLSHSVSYTVVRNLIVTQTLNLNSDGAGYLANPNFISSETISISGPNSSPEDVF